MGDPKKKNRTLIEHLYAYAFYVRHRGLAVGDAYLKQNVAAGLLRKTIRESINHDGEPIRSNGDLFDVLAFHFPLRSKESAQQEKTATTEATSDSVDPSREIVLFKGKPELEQRIRDVCDKEPFGIPVHRRSTICLASTCERVRVYVFSKHVRVLVRDPESISGVYRHGWSDSGATVSEAETNLRKSLACRYGGHGQDISWLTDAPRAQNGEPNNE